MVKRKLRPQIPQIYPYLKDQHTEERYFTSPDSTKDAEMDTEMWPYLSAVSPSGGDKTCK